jgi:hypothetical protein
MLARLSDYEAALSEPRGEFPSLSGLSAMLDSDVEQDTLELFLIHFSAFGVAMTEPVDGWIRRAGERCASLGLNELGRSLVMHADHEAGHHLMMIEDTKLLVQRWNARHTQQIDASELLGRAPTPGVRSYSELHERTISGDAPFGQLAIEYEIERLSLVHGPQLIGHCVEKLGQDVVAGLSFLEEHVAVDAGHTKFNAAQLDRLLQGHPKFLSALVAAGSAALSAYAAFLQDCAAAARTLRPLPEA